MSATPKSDYLIYLLQELAERRLLQPGGMNPVHMCAITRQKWYDEIKAGILSLERELAEVREECEAQIKVKLDLHRELAEARAKLETGKRLVADCCSGPCEVCTAMDTLNASCPKVS